MVFSDREGKNDELMGMTAGERQLIYQYFTKKGGKGGRLRPIPTWRVTLLTNTHEKEVM